MEEGSVGWECEQRSPPKFPSLEVASTTTGYAVTAFDEDKIVWTTDLPALPTAAAASPADERIERRTSEETRNIGLCLRRLDTRLLSGGLFLPANSCL